jgi:hypothetical protein
VNGTRILEFSVNDAEVSAPSDSSALISLAIEHQAALVILPASELNGAFFQLKTGVAGDLIQKFVNYRLRLAIIGDVAAYDEQSAALRAFISESNRGRTLPGLLRFRFSNLGFSRIWIVATPEFRSCSRLSGQNRIFWGLLPDSQ